MEKTIIEQKNEEIAKMLGWTSKTRTIEQAIVLSYFNSGGQFIGVEFQFHSDWNWIMEAVKFINSTHKHSVEARDLTYTLQGLSLGGYWNNSDVRENSINFNSIDDVFDAVYRFAKTWNNKYA